MCPYRKFKQREFITPWIYPSIYKAMRKPDALVRLFRQTGHTRYLELTRICRNQVNGLIRKAKSEFIKRQLTINESNPKKFWRIIKGLLCRTADSSSNAHFIDHNTQTQVEKGMEPEFLNDYFINIVRNLNIPDNDVSMDTVYNVNDIFTWEDDMPTPDEVNDLIKGIDINKSSCVDGISAKFCKKAILSVPNVICDIMSKSLRNGMIPSAWTRGTINVIPKGGDLTDPENWRPITQTSLFAKLIEKLVHKRLLRYLTRNNIISDFQFDFYRVDQLNLQLSNY